MTTNVDFNFGNRGFNAVGGLLGAFFGASISWTFLELTRKERTQIHPLQDIFRSLSSPYPLGIVILHFASLIFIFFWSLLFIIPGIIKSYAYSQMYFIYYDEKERTGQVPSGVEAITRSRQLMDGHKMRLFLLDLSFIGWHLLAILTLGIGYLWLNPYIDATKAAFYDDLVRHSA